MNKSSSAPLVSNAALRAAIDYPRSHWTNLTRCQCVPGAPLDKNVVNSNWSTASRPAP